MNPCELNAIITALANYFYATLSEKDFLFLKVFLTELSKTMCSMELLRNICALEDKKPPLFEKKEIRSPVDTQKTLSEKQSLEQIKKHN